MSKVLVAYYSLEGNMKLVAEQVAQELGGEICPLTPVKKYPTGGFSKYFWCGGAAKKGDAPELEPISVKPEEYDIIVLACPVWAGCVTPPMRTFLQAHTFAGKTVAGVVCCAGGKTEKCFAQIEELLGQKLSAQLRLVDPAKHKDPEWESKVKAFCDELRKSLD